MCSVHSHITSLIIIKHNKYSVFYHVKHTTGTIGAPPTLSALCFQSHLLYVLFNCFHSNWNCINTIRATRRDASHHKTQFVLGRLITNDLMPLLLLHYFSSEIIGFNFHFKTNSNFLFTFCWCLFSL